MALNGINTIPGFYQQIGMQSNLLKPSDLEKGPKKEKTDSAKEERTSNTQAKKKVQKDEPELSSKAKEYLEELKKKYTNMDFMVHSFETDEEANEYMARGTKEYSVLIDPETLEKMASDEEERAKFESVLEGAGAQFETLAKELGEDVGKVKSMGISVDKDGIVSFFAQIEKDNKDYSEAVSKNREEKAKEKEKAETRLVKAESMEQLIEKLKKGFASGIWEDMSGQEAGQILDIKV